jgi:DNA repair exonuclease SbcCD ATPase subunit
LPQKLNERINKLQNLSNEVSKASTAAKLKEVAFTYMETQAIDLIDREIEHLQVKVSENKNTSDENNKSDGNKSDEQISSRITELTAFKESINGARSLEDLRTIMSSSRGIFGPPW